MLNYNLKQFLIHIFTSFSVFLLPTLPVFLITGFLVSTDLLLGYLTNNKLYNESFQSEKVKRTLIKFLIYGACIIVANTIDFVIIGYSIVVKATMCYIILAELRSYDEKYYKIYGKFIIKEITEFFSKLLDKYKK